LTPPSIRADFDSKCRIQTTSGSAFLQMLTYITMLQYTRFNWLLFGNLHTSAPNSLLRLLTRASILFMTSSTGVHGPLNGRPLEYMQSWLYCGGASRLNKQIASQRSRERDVLHFVLINLKAPPEYILYSSEAAHERAWIRLPRLQFIFFISE